MLQFNHWNPPYDFADTLKKHARFENFNASNSSCFPVQNMYVKGFDEVINFMSTDA